MEFDNDDNHEYQRPRRPNPETISYLRSLPLHVAESHHQVTKVLEFYHHSKNVVYQTDDDDDDNAYPSIFFAAMMALMEVSGEMASLAADEQGSECLEVMAHICLPYSETCAKLCFTSMQGYYVFLSTHRFGSHVLQTILQLGAATMFKRGEGSNKRTHAFDDRPLLWIDDLAQHPEAPSSSSSQTQATSESTLSSLILGFSEEVLPYASSLACHICGSHVLRSLLCVLGGVELVGTNNDPSQRTIHNSSSSDGGIGITGPWERRGKQKQKKKKKGGQKVDEMVSSSSSANHPTPMIYLSEFPDETTFETTFLSALTKLTDALTGNSSFCDKDRDHRPTAVAAPGHVQQLACHPSAGPLLAVLLRVWTYSDPQVKLEWQDKLTTSMAAEEQQQQQQRRLGLRRPEPTFRLESPAHQLVKRLLCVVGNEKSAIASSSSSSLSANSPNNKHDPAVTTATNPDLHQEQQRQPHAPDVVYGLAGKARGSHVLETIMCLCHDTVYASLLDWGDFTNATTLREYLEHPVSNFCIVTLMATIRTANQAGRMIKALDNAISSGYIVDPQNKRRAVLWRAAEMAAKFRIGQDTILKAIRLGFISLQNSGSSGAPAEFKQPSDDSQIEQDANADTHQNKKKRRKASSISIQDCIRPLLGLSAPDESREADIACSSDARIQLDVLGTRTVYHLLRFAPRLSIDIVDGIVQTITRHELELIAKDGFGSFCVMDGILDLVSVVSTASSSGDTTSSGSLLAPAYRQLLLKLQGKWVTLATDRIGHHCVIKLFHALQSMDDKQLFVSELAKSRSKLKGSVMGRKVIEVCAMAEYTESDNCWRHALAKRRKREDFLNGIVAHDVNETQHQQQQETKIKGRKRDKQVDVPTTESSKMRRKKKGKGVPDAAKTDLESIMKAISIPQSRLTN